MFLKNQSNELTILKETNEVQVGRKKTKLTPKEMGVLSLLYEKNGKTVSRTELLKTVWGDKYANDQGLTQAVSRLRAIVKNQNISIKTIPKNGYLFEHEKRTRRFTLGVIKVNLNAVLILFLVLTICVLVFVQRIEIRIDEIKPAQEKIGNAR